MFENWSPGWDAVFFLIWGSFWTVVLVWIAKRSER
jgi:hypothetical protein